MTRTSGRLGTVAGAAAATLLAAGVVAAPADAATTTYTSTVPVPVGRTQERSLPADGSGTIGINDAFVFGPGKASPYPSVASVSGLVGTVSKVTVRIGSFSHQYPQDVDIMLVSPSTERVMLMSDVAGTLPVSGKLLHFDDAGAPMPTTHVFDGTVYRPTNSGTGDEFPAPAPYSDIAAGELSAFEGEDPNGFWSLYVVDDSLLHTGSIQDWSISITTTGSDNYPATVDVAGATGTVTDVDVSLSDLSHGRPEDVDLVLIGPRGQQATLLSDVPQASAVEDVDLTLDDSAATTVSAPITSGTYRPTNLGSGADVYPAPAPPVTGASSLSVFNGTDPNGTWRLYAADDGSGQAGEILGWSLRITTAPIPGGTPTAPAPGGGTPTAPTPGGTPTAPEPDATGDSVHPRVTGIAPAVAAAGVRRGASITARLSEAVRPSTVTGATAYLVRAGSSRHVRGTVSWRPDTKRVVINPRRDLRGGTTYRAVITTAVRDLVGNRLDQQPTRAGLQQKTWRFTTR